MRLGYNTNGFAHHHWEDSLEIIAEIGYQSVAITVDHHFLNPYADDFEKQRHAVKSKLDNLGLTSVIETGSRFLLNPKEKHEPTLLRSHPEERRQRVEFLSHCFEVAHVLESEAVSFWAGCLKENISKDEALENLFDGCLETLRIAEMFSMPIAFEPEPGMLIETMADFEQLEQRIHHPLFGLTLDIGHLQCVEETPIPDILDRWCSQTYNIHIEDMKKGVHDHLFFGEGEIDFNAVFASLEKNNYSGPIQVELSRHSHDAVNVAQQSYQFLKSKIISPS